MNDSTDPIGDAERFPALDEGINLLHAGVTPLCGAARDAMRDYLDHAARRHQEDHVAEEAIGACRQAAAQLIGARASEIALIAPTAAGINQVAGGWPWQAGDEVIYNPDDYPTNVYVWRALARRGVTPVPIRSDAPGRIDWDEHILPLLTPRTRMVALATCHYLSGWRIDYQRIGRQLRERDILFSLDGIQSLGAFPLDATCCDFLSADSHKWLLGPCGAGFFYCERRHHETLQPLLLGSKNVYSPRFIAQDDIDRFYPGASRYEPGTPNVAGIVGFGAALDELNGVGIAQIAARILARRAELLAALEDQGWRLMLDPARAEHDARSGIITVSHPDIDAAAAERRLKADGISASLRHDRHDRAYLRFAPHAYNRPEQMLAVARSLHGLS